VPTPAPRSKAPHSCGSKVDPTKSKALASFARSPGRGRPGLGGQWKLVSGTWSTGHNQFDMLTGLLAGIPGCWGAYFDAHFACNCLA
jgi:hypothetical protein